MNPNENTVEKDSIVKLVADLLRRINKLETQLLLLQKRVLDLENP